MDNEGANGDVTYTETEVESMRLKFRKEALKACNESQKKGYAAGRKDSAQDIA